MTNFPSLISSKHGELSLSALLESPSLNVSRSSSGNIYGNTNISAICSASETCLESPSDSGLGEAASDSLDVHFSPLYGRVFTRASHYFFSSVGDSSSSGSNPDLLPSLFHYPDAHFSSPSTSLVCSSTTSPSRVLSAHFAPESAVDAVDLSLHRAPTNIRDSCSFPASTSSSTSASASVTTTCLAPHLILETFPQTRNIFEAYIQPCWEVASDVGTYWWKHGISSVCPVFIQRRILKKQMDRAKNYAEWYSLALELDKINGLNRWKREFESSDYDNELIEERLEDLRIARKSGDLRKMMFLLREGLHRNLGGIGNPSLYDYCHVGTKSLIENYIDEVVYQLNYICDTESPQVSAQEKLEFFADTRQAYGRSALMLSGGGTLGAYHFGTLRCLHELKLLPRIISGSSVGSLIASLLCLSKDSELAEVLQCMKLDLVEKTGIAKPWHEKLTSFLKHGTLCDIKIMEECCRSVAGDVTFQEAYNRTRRILNITVNSTGQYEVPRLLNYLTSPNVLIWSAACASCALTGLFAPVELMAKDSAGRIVPWNPSGQKWSDGSVESDLPMDRLSELFNVNHFIVCQVNPHANVFFTRLPKKGRFSGFISSLKFLAFSELDFRLKQLGKMGIAPKTVINIRGLVSQKYQGDITIVPRIRFRDYLSVVGPLSDEFLRNAADEGEKACWSKIAIIRNHCEVELTLDRVLYRLRQQLFTDTVEEVPVNARRLKSCVY